MLILIMLLSTFLCFMSWGQFSKMLHEIPRGKNSWWLMPLLPFIATGIFLYVNWIFLAAVAWLSFIFFKWSRHERLSLSMRLLGCLAMTAMGFEFFLQKLSQLSQANEPEMWIFWLGDTSWQGLAIGFAIAAIFQTLNREKGHAWWLAPALILSGIGSLGLAWGIFLGDRWDAKNWKSSIFSLVGILLGLLLMGSYLPQFKLQYWLIACLVWICAEIPVFHRQGKN